MLQIYPLDKKRAKFSLFCFHFKKWHTLLFLPLWTSFKPIKDLKKKKHKPNKHCQVIEDQIFTIIKEEYQFCF